MRLGRKFSLIAAFTALAAALLFAFGGAPAAAHGTHDETGETVHRNCTWTVDKTAGHHTSVTLLEGQPFDIGYTITLTARCSDQHHAVDGGHHAPNGHLHSPPNHIVDECVSISDPQAPAFGDGVVCLSELTSGSITFRYTRSFGPFSECGEFSFTNTVTVRDLVHEVHPAGHVLAEDSVTINIRVLCDRGCTLTQGYWKTHSDQGPAPYDDTWALLGDVDGDGNATEDEGELFFSSGQTWLEVFRTPPSGGNVYYQLAHQYMAAVLNQLGGASSTPAVDAALAAAVSFFTNSATDTPAEAGALGKNSTTRKNAQAAASTLGSYNEGAIGPGHCDSNENGS